MPTANSKSTQKNSSDSGLVGMTDPLKLSIKKPEYRIDIVTIMGLFLAFSLIASALFFGGSPLSFFNVPALLIVLGGTCAVTAISYSSKELSNAGKILGHSLSYKNYDSKRVAKELLDIACIIRARGPLALNQAQRTLKNHESMKVAAQLLIDDSSQAHIKTVLHHNISQLIERHKVGIGILRRAADIAPAMGLIGTLVGLVQMLSQLSEPSSIGPAMAIALLTTFYGAILGTVILSPMAAKLERNSADEIMVREMIMKATMMIADKEHPRRIETFLNSLLPPHEQIRYFD
jgi:chemotaxis protein MotA